MRGGFLVWLCFLGALFSACGAVTHVDALVIRPATIPLRSFPRVWVASGFLPEERAIADALVRHLRAQGRVEARWMDPDTLEPLRQRGEIPPATLVVRIAVSAEESLRTDWSTRPETVCGPVGCYTRNRSYTYSIPMVRAQLVLTVHDGPSARVEQRVRLRATDEGREYGVLRHRVTAQLIRRLQEMVDQRIEEVEIPVLEMDRPEVEQAIAHMQQGEWRAARRLLHRLHRGPTFAQLPPDQQARLFYNLGHAYRFDPRAQDDPEAFLQSAERAYERALQLDRDDRYREALAALRSYRREMAAITAQREAADRNFRIGREAPSVPEPPASYR